MITRAILSNRRTPLSRSGRGGDAMLAVARYRVPAVVNIEKPTDYYYGARLLDFINSTGRWGINAVCRAIAEQDRFRDGKNRLLDLFIERTLLLMRDISPRGMHQDEIWSNVVKQLAVSKLNSWIAIDMSVAELYPRKSRYFELIITIVLVALSKTGWEPQIAKILCSPLMRLNAEPDIQTRLTIVTSRSRVRWEWWYRSWLRRCAAGEILPFINPPRISSVASNN